MLAASHLNFRKSSYSSAKGEDCVEVADTGARAAVRDTQNRGAGHLSFSATEWKALLDEVRAENL
ncbi:uncharacterized protein DUF397 [Haloactinospora alba]|uniref:Uncharacterized protein DUF397 n=1 Tax=Haloactinospora alba TaxID=405555 RepID=A0A543N707_9ACTN|nr:DUF397 domain-containing protein [Haloactinospora alba]TQN27612.1 uncharacterized protein DUF397 [Haloactinospora alba]